MLEIDLSGKVALITGASGELGRTMARTCADCGADIVVHYHRNEAKAQEIVQDIESKGRRALAVSAAIDDLDSMTELKRKVVDGLGVSPHIVIANAVSQIHPWESVLEEALEDYEDQFRSCVMQNVVLSKVFLPEMIERKAGRYIGISTECVMQLHPRFSAYASGKRGMDAVLRVLAKEVGEHQITVNQVAPGYTISDSQREKGVTPETTYDETIPLRRRGTDQELAQVVAFLASDLASYVTGAFIPVCGGRVMPTI